jgi:hypothetical protein
MQPPKEYGFGPTDPMNNFRDWSKHTFSNMHIKLLKYVLIKVVSNIYYNQLLIV